VIAEGASFGDIMMAYLIVGILGAILLLMGIIKAITHGSFKILNSNVIFIVIGAIVIAIGASLLIDNGTIIAKSLGVPETVIGLTFVALGTSLPELVTAVTALVKGHSALSLGNIIGANIFNLVLVSGMAITISPFAVPAEKTISGMNASLIIDLPLVFAVMGILTIPTLFKGKLSRWQGIVLLALYAGFCVFQFI
jgi:cation:H+ antiporter